MRVTAGLLVGSLLTLTLGCHDLAEPPEEDTSVEVAPAETGTAVAITNLRVSSGKAYKVVSGGVQVGAVYYIDRSYQLQSPIPYAVKGLTLIRTARADNNARPGSSSFLSFDVDRDVTVYVAHDDRIARPLWLKSGFKDTGTDLLTDDWGGRLSLFRRTFSKGRVTLGSNTASAGPNYAMYVVAVGAAAGGSTHAGWYVSPSGSSSAAGTASAPWSLAHALAGAAGKVRAGDTVWVRGGTYRGSFSSSLGGSTTAPIVVRAYPGERATIDGRLVVNGAQTWIWGLEVMQSNPVSTSRIALDVFGVGTKLINNVVHDAGMSGVGFWWNAQTSEMTGNIIYNNGTHNNLDHGIYFNNRTGTKLLRDNIVFNNWTYGFHGYSPFLGELINLTLEGNVGFNNGSTGGLTYAPDILVGGNRITGLRVARNYTYRNNDGSRSVLLGGFSQPSTNGDLVLTDNTFVGRPAYTLNQWGSVIERGTRTANSASPPTSGTWVVVRPNPYEAGRANVVVYNWGRAATVSVDVSHVLQPGDVYELRNVQAFFGTPTLSGTYAGGSLQVPMGGVAAPRPIGRSAIRSLPATGPVFNAFVLRRIRR